MELSATKKKKKRFSAFTLIFRGFANSSYSDPNLSPTLPHRNLYLTIQRHLCVKSLPYDIRPGEVRPRFQLDEVFCELMLHIFFCRDCESKGLENKMSP